MRKLLTAAIMMFAMSGHAQALCLVLGVTSASISTAIPTGTLSPTSQNAVAATISVTILLGLGTNDTCGLAVKIRGTLTSGSGASVPYSISTNSSGSPTISYTVAPSSLAPISAATVTLPVYLMGAAFLSSYVLATLRNS